MELTHKPTKKMQTINYESEEAGEMKLGILIYYSMLGAILLFIFIAGSMMTPDEFLYGFSAYIGSNWIDWLIILSILLGPGIAYLYHTKRKAETNSEINSRTEK
ncbi:hypothetical protein [Marinibactrum halimedae]|uniref:Uncharacterized protein n=1 Tax=Marinibactrum halimedae TaxID=1444977 RepID=A0AA37WN61_9GAMM|nr:hypothetical protein [Marinibactrum halimedae]MCD9458922.1 hypothetical protein [Marinibactrum halimedae]GLS27769.1 hypothetical protein GCM10007877_34880 [Marinibactrum halimedae]